MAAVFGIAGLAAAGILLWRPNLMRSIPLVVAVTVVTAALARHPLLAAPLATVLGLLAMLRCWRRTYRRRSTRTT